MENKVAIVTGASRGIGKQIALQLAREGYNLILSYQSNDEKAKQVQLDCEAYNVSVNIYKGDLSSEDNCKSLIDLAITSFGKIDLLVNNAGAIKDNLILKMTSEDFMSVISINLLSTFNCCKYASKIMVKQRYGCIINMSSVSGVFGNAGQANYSSAKAGIVGLTKTLAKELGKRNIRVNAIAPGFISTDMTNKFSDDMVKEIEKQIPLSKIGDVEDIAKTVSFLANSTYITGQVIVVDGGLSL